MYIYILKRKKICTKQPLSGVNVPMHSIFQNPLVNFMKIYLPKNCELFYPDSHEWPRHSFSQQCQNNIKHTSDENEEKYKLGDY